MPLTDRERDVLLGHLCSSYGFCLGGMPDALAEAARRDDPGRFLDEVIRADGVNPDGVRRDLYRRMNADVQQAFDSSVWNLVPKHKGDISHIADLAAVDVSDVEPILPALLTWLQDGNWLVAHRLPDVLPRFHEGLTPLILRVLAPDEPDHLWKYWIICRLLDNWPDGSLAQLLPSISRIASEPTAGEHYEEVDEVAQEFLNRRAGRVRLA